MAVVKNYIGWATNVNRIILDSTTITLGDKATITDELNSGLKRTRLKGPFCPDIYQVTMDFDWVTVGSDGLTEIQRFYEWYKFKHKYGTVPFEFPKIIYSHETGVASSSYGSRVEYYKITSAVEAKKYGTSQRVTMTWETVYAGVISIQEQPAEVSNLECTSNYVDINFSYIGDTAPLSSDFEIKLNGSVLSDFGFYYDNSLKVRIYFPQQYTSYEIEVIHNEISYKAIFGGN